MSHENWQDRYTALAEKFEQCDNERVALEAKVVQLRGLYGATMNQLEYLAKQHEPCDVHHGARRACGQCMSSTERHLANARTEIERLRAALGPLLKNAEARCELHDCSCGTDSDSVTTARTILAEMKT